MAEALPTAKFVTTIAVLSDDNGESQPEIDREDMRDLKEDEGRFAATPVSRALMMAI